jgi:PAS domain S-box-containing protein
MHFSPDGAEDGGTHMDLRAKYLQDLMEYGPAVMYLTDRDGRFIAVNRKFASLFGLDQSEIAGKRRDEFMPPEIARQHLNNDIKVMEGGERIIVEEQNQESDGLHHYMTYKFPLRDEDRNIVGVAGISLDITEQKNAEEALSLEQDFIEAIFNSVPGMLYLYDTDGHIVRWNKKHELMTGYTTGELSGMTLADWYKGDEESLAAVMKGLAATMTSGFGEAEANLRKKDGTTIPMYFTACPLKIRGQQYFTGIGIDITERKRAERAIRESEERFENLFQRAPLGYQSLDEDGKFIEVNEAWLSTLGYRREDVIGKWFGDFLAPEHVDIFRELFPAFKRNGKAHVEFVMIHANGDSRTIAFDGRVGYRKDGSFEKTHCILQDITEQKRVAADKERLQEQLQQSQKMESIGRLAGGIAHDYNNMLGVISGYCELALGKVSQADPVYPDLQEIQAAAKRSADLTRQLLAFARKQTVAPEILDLNTTVESMLKMLRLLIGEDIRLDWDPGANVKPVRMDPSQINQILANLCVNARDAITGGGTITIETDTVTFDREYCDEHAEFLPGAFVMLAVSDDGCGMSREIRDKIFEPFFTTKELGHGTGLGLATVYGIVKQNDGFINVYSEVNKGTTFKIYLPQQAEGDSSAKLGGVKEIPKTKGETILVVEDEPALLRMTKTMLEQFGYRVLAAKGGKEAVETAEDYEGTIDLVLTDIVMPEMNGRDLAERIAKLYPGIRQLFMSGYTAKVIASKGVIDEGMHFIQKPFSAGDLAAKVRLVLKGE